LQKFIVERVDIYGKLPVLLVIAEDGKVSKRAQNSSNSKSVKKMMFEFL
jgi:hypothetical protein